MKKAISFFSIAIGLTGLLGTAQADVVVHFINKTNKALEFSLMIPRTKIYSNLTDGHVAAHSTQRFSFHQLLPNCAQKSWRCAKLKPVVQHWGRYVVFTECPKIYNSSRRQNRWYKLTGSDTAHLRCRITRKPKAAKTQ